MYVFSPLFTIATLSAACSICRAPPSLVNIYGGIGDLCKGEGLMGTLIDGNDRYAVKYSNKTFQCVNDRDVNFLLWNEALRQTRRQHTHYCQLRPHIQYSFHLSLENLLWIYLQHKANIYCI